MRAAILILCLLFSFGAHADENEDLAREMAELHGDLERVVKQLQEKGQLLNGEKFAPARAKAMQLASDDNFLKAAQDLWSHPSRNTLLIAQAIFFAIMFLLKAWRQSVTKNWFKKILVGAFLGLTTWAGLLVVLPYAFLGEPYRIFVLTIWRVFTA